VQIELEPAERAKDFHRFGDDLRTDASPARTAILTPA